MMIGARKQRVFNAWFARHARSRIFATFGEVRVYGLRDTLETTASRPVLFLCNHTSWWDAIVAIYVSNHLMRVDAYAMMDAANLRRLPFFSRVGAFGVDVDRASDGAAAIRYTARLLDRVGRAVWLFPQGRERPVTERPLVFRPGSAEIARVARSAVAIPVALRYEFGCEQRPSLFISFGPPLATGHDLDETRALHERAVEEELGRIDRAVCDPAGAGRSFTTVHRARPSRTQAVAEVLLARLMRSGHHVTPPPLEAGPRDQR